MLDRFVVKVCEYVSKDETRTLLENKLLHPVLSYLGERFAWCVRIFHAIAVLLVLQTVILLWLLVRSLRHD